MTKRDQNQLRNALPSWSEGLVGVRRWSPRLGLALGMICLGLLAGFWLRGAPPQLPAPASIPEAEPEIPTVPEGPLKVELPLSRIDRLLSVGGRDACATGRGSLACSRDGGQTWSDFGTVGEPILAVMELADGSLLAAAADGGLYLVAEGREPAFRMRPEGSLQVVDAAARDGAIVLLAHRYDEPTDELRIPRVVETILLAVAADGELREMGRSRGFGGERLLLERDAVVTWALSDLRAWRSRNGGRTLQRLQGNERFGADFGGLRAVVERRSERLPGPGRPARLVSSLWVDREQGAWERALELPGSLLVDFADENIGVVVAKEEGTAWLTIDGGRSFEAFVQDERLQGIADLSHVDGRFVVALAEGTVWLLEPLAESAEETPRDAENSSPTVVVPATR